MVACLAAGIAHAQGVTGSWEGEAATAPWPAFLTLSMQPNGDGELRVSGQAMPITNVAEAEQTVLTLGPADQGVRLEGAAGAEAFVGRLVMGSDSFPVHLRKVPAYPKPASRAEAWTQDIDALETRFLAADRTFSGPERNAFLKRTGTLKREAAALDDPHLIMALASAIALSSNAHTRLYLLRNRTELRRLPIRVWWFADGLYVVRAAAPHHALLGCRVVSIDGVEARAAKARVRQAFAGNDSWAEYMSTYSLTSPTRSTAWT